MFKVVKKTINIFKLKLNEKTFNDEVEIKYLLFPNSQSRELLVVFSAFPDIDQSAKYHYLNAFKTLECNKLYILDNYGPNKRGGSYYLANNKNFKIEKSVERLISKIAQEMSVSNADIITTGTSKGGFAALYYATKYNYSAAVVGAPQTLLGDYLNKDGGEIFLKYITGDISSNSVEYLNKLLFSQINRNKNCPQFYIHVGIGEPHYKEHVLPFISHLRRNKIPYFTDFQNYNNHHEVGTFFPQYAIESISGMLKNNYSK